MTFTEFETTIEKIVTTQEEILQVLDRIVAAYPTKDYITVQDIAKRQGCSAAYLYQHPWLLPFFGRRTTARGWTVQEYKSWYGESMDTRKMQWDMLDAAERRQILAERKKRRVAA